jgi:hypothetical protein
VFPRCQARSVCAATVAAGKVPKIIGARGARERAKCLGEREVQWAKRGAQSGININGSLRIPCGGCTWNYSPP